MEFSLSVDLYLYADVVIGETLQAEEINEDRDRVLYLEEETGVGLESPDVISETLNEAEGFFGSTSERKLGKRARKAPVCTARTLWSKEEEEEIKTRFKRFFDEKKRPRPSDCLRMIRRSEKENGLLGKRRKDVLKKKVYRMIDKLF